jgi:hypothetical protein
MMRSTQPGRGSLVEGLLERGFARDAQLVEDLGFCIRWIGRIVSTVNVTFTHGANRVSSLEEAKQRESKIAVTGAGAALAIFTRALASAVGIKFKTINGYTDAAASLLAVERGEVDGAAVSWNSLKNMRPQWLKDGSAHILVQYAHKSHSHLRGCPLQPP